VSRPPPPFAEVTDEQRARFLAAARSFRGATLQKLWLPSAALAVLQLRIPGKTALVLLDARLTLVALVEERPTGTESAPKSQATLRAALEGSRFAEARFETAPGSTHRSVRLSFETPAGPRALIAEASVPALLLVGPARGGGERIVWAAAGAGPERRPGAAYREVVALEEPAPPGGGGVPPPPGGARRAQHLVEEPASTPGSDRDLLVRAVAREEQSGVAARRKELEKSIRARVQKLRRALAAVDEDAARASAAAEDRRKGELLVPNQAAVPRGASEARVPDWSAVDDAGAPREVVLRLDPSRSAAENAARWFRRAARYTAALPRIGERRREVADALAEAESLLARAATVRDAAELRALETETRIRKPQRASAREGARMPFRAFRSRSGARILVGRSAKDNDELLRAARGNDLWLHARGATGSHVVVPDPGEAPDERTVRDAALLAAYFSSARGSDAAEVACTRRKYVRKAKGAAAGAVTYSQERTVRVRLDPDSLRELLASE
jgi:NFACT N-terminal and middle domains/NFACT protein RNA binding domain